MLIVCESQCVLVHFANPSLLHPLLEGSCCSLVKHGRMLFCLLVGVNKTWEGGSFRSRALVWPTAAFLLSTVCNKCPSQPLIGSGEVYTMRQLVQFGLSQHVTADIFRVAAFEELCSTNSTLHTDPRTNWAIYYVTVISSRRTSRQANNFAFLPQIGSRGPHSAAEL